MATKIIDGKNKQGRRISCSIDPEMWKLLVADCGSEHLARGWVRTRLFQCEDRYKPTSYVRHMMLMRLIKPSVIRKALGLEGQMDIEEF